MSTIDISAVKLLRPSSRLIGGFQLDAPSPRSRHRIGAVEIKGWMLNGEIPVRRMEVIREDGEASEIRTGFWRADIAYGYPHVKGAERSGFRAFVDLSNLGPVFRFRLEAVLENGERIGLAELDGRRSKIEEQAEDPLAPSIVRRQVPAALVKDRSRPRASIIIPVHGQSRFTKQCLGQLLTPGNISLPFEIIVVDDASPDDTQAVLAEYSSSVLAAHLSPNAGFGAACNTGAALARGDYLVFLNNDTLPEPGWLNFLVDHADRHMEAGVVGARLLYPEMTIQHAGVAFAADGFPHHLYAGLAADHPAVTKSRRLQAVTAACCLVRAQLFRALDGFDRQFMNGWEDVDFCLRAGEIGQEIHYCADAIAIHFESVSRSLETPTEIRNRDLWSQRWLGKVQPDCYKIWSEDDLLYVDVVGPLYPLRIRYASELAFVEQLPPGWARKDGSERPLVAAAAMQRSVRQSPVLHHRRDGRRTTKSVRPYPAVVRVSKA